jgi:uncharacterized phage protein (predicted DNA packaging)
MLLTTDEIGHHLRIDDALTDPMIEVYEAAAVDYVSMYLGRDVPWSTETESQVFPASIKAALLLLVADLYENREAATAGVKIESNPTVERLLSPYRVEYGV